MHATTGGTRSLTARKCVTVDDEENMTASAPPTFASSAAGWPHGHRPVGLDHVDLPSPRPQPVGQHVARRPRRAARSTVPGAVRPRLEEALGHEPLRHQVGDDAVRRERLGGAGPTTATRAAPKPRASRSEREQAVTALADVNTTQS